MFNKKYKFQYLISILNQLKKHQFMTCYSSLHFIFLKMTISIPIKLEISTATFTFLEPSFSWFGTHFDNRPKLLIYRQVPPNIFFLLLNFPIKIKVSQILSNWFVFKDTRDYKRVVRRSAHPRYDQVIIFTIIVTIFITKLYNVLLFLYNKC